MKASKEILCGALVKRLDLYESMLAALSLQVVSKNM